jgi:predicted NAD/FAD-dependent oxidoreductase
MNLPNACTTKIALIGAGVTGLTCARQLKANGHEPIVFEKSRGLGGRLATRRLKDGVTFDHGAQYLIARSTAFQSVLQKAAAVGAADHWRPRVHEQSTLVPDSWIVGSPTMNALIKPLAHGIDVRLNVQVTSIEREGHAWRVRTLTDKTGQVYDIVVCTVPAPQAHDLLFHERSVAAALADVTFAPCLALMLTFSTRIEPGFDVRRSEADAFSWIARNSSKPCRPSEKDAWVVHASPTWSTSHLGVEREQVARKMVEMLPAAFGCRLPEIEHVCAHSWLYALTTAPLNKPYLCSEDRSLFVGGDWCLGPRIECAFASGDAIANALTGVSTG